MARSRSLKILLIVAITVTLIAMAIVGISIANVIEQSDKIHEQLTSRADGRFPFNPSRSDYHTIGIMYLSTEPYEIVLVSEDYSIDQYDWEIVVDIYDTESSTLEYGTSITNVGGNSGSYRDLEYFVIGSFTPSRAGLYEVYFQSFGEDIPTFSHPEIVIHRGNVSNTNFGMAISVIGIIFGGIILLVGCCASASIGILFLFSEPKRTQTPAIRRDLPPVASKPSYQVPMESQTPYQAPIRPQPAYQAPTATPIGMKDESYLPCPNCQRKNPVSSVFCEYCGVKLIHGCPSCGTEKKLTDRFCVKCGRKFE